MKKKRKIGQKRTRSELRKERVKKVREESAQRGRATLSRYVLGRDQEKKKEEKIYNEPNLIYLAESVKEV